MLMLGQELFQPVDWKLRWTEPDSNKDEAEQWAYAWAEKDRQEVRRSNQLAVRQNMVTAHHQQIQVWLPSPTH